MDVHCPACGAVSKAGVGASAVCFSCGTPIGRAISQMPQNQAQNAPAIVSSPVAQAPQPAPMMQAPQAAPSPSIQIATGSNRAPATNVMGAMSFGSSPAASQASSPMTAPMPANAASHAASAQAPKMNAPVISPSPSYASAQAPAMYPLTGAIPERAAPPTNPYSAPERAILTSAAGEYVVRGGTEVKVGRDPSQCGIVLTEPRVSGVHATLKFEGVQLWAKDEVSNNGMFVDGARAAPGEWIPVRSGAQLRFGPVEMIVRVE